MSAPIPHSKPKASLELVVSSARKRWEIDNDGKPLPEFFVLAVRGYYEQSMGNPDQNDVSMYDDAFFIVSPLGFTAWNGNTDPSRYGWNANADKYMARLKPGCWRFIHRMHRGKYLAFGQSENVVTVERIDSNGQVRQTETGCFGIDLHKGGITGTSSEGCNTVPVGQWDAFYQELRGTMRKLAVSTFDFVLIDGPIN